MRPGLYSRVTAIILLTVSAVLLYEFNVSITVMGAISRGIIIRRFELALFY